jgi:hypothetical protein
MSGAVISYLELPEIEHFRSSIRISFCSIVGGDFVNYWTGICVIGGADGIMIFGVEVGE